jgi:hypothetical protein
MRQEEVSLPEFSRTVFGKCYDAPGEVERTILSGR